MSSMSPITTLSAACAANGATSARSAAETAASHLVNVIPVFSGRRPVTILFSGAQGASARDVWVSAPLYHARRGWGQDGRCLALRGKWAAQRVYRRAAA